jgi:regulator of nucleoside diphosphate kinase
MTAILQDRPSAARRNGQARPAIYVSAGDRLRLSALLGSSSGCTPGAALLADELERAIIVDADELPRAFARLGSAVTYEDLGSHKVRTDQLVMPEDADVDLCRISVLSPVGAALLGLTAGAEIALSPDRDRVRVLRVVAVSDAS